MPATPPPSSSRQLSSPPSPSSLSASASPSTPGPPTPPEHSLALDDIPSSPSPEQQQAGAGQQRRSPAINGQHTSELPVKPLEEQQHGEGEFTTTNVAGSQTRNAVPPASSASSPVLGSSQSPTANGTTVNGVTGPRATEPESTSSATDAATTATPVATTTGGAAADTSHSDADGECFSDEWLADMRRVKVYELVGQRWTDRGTALCTGIYDEELDQAAIVARSETENSDVELLRSEIRMNDVYQRQQDTLIVWTEPDGTDYALSFQDVEGCAEIWDFIIEVQRHFRGKLGDIGASSSSPTRDHHRGINANQIINDGRLPQPTLGIIVEIDKAIKFIGRTATGKEKICEYIVQEDYIKGLIDVMSQAEDLEELSDLHALCNLVQTILMMNDHSIYDYILQDDIYMGVIGMLEYDPDFPTYKASFREYLANSTQYKEVVVFRDETIRKKIHQTYRLQYLKDVVLARVLDDPTFNVLNSFILFNQIDIIAHIQNDEVLLKDLFGRFEKPEVIGSTAETTTKLLGEGKGKEKEVNGHLSAVVPASSAASTSTALPATLPVPSFLANLSPSDASKRDIIILLHQLCMMGKNVQIPARLTLYRALVDKGLLHCLQWALSRPAEDQQILNAAGEILLIVCDHDVSGVRAFVLKQADPNGEWDKATPAAVGFGVSKGPGLGAPGLTGFYGPGGLETGLGAPSDVGAGTMGLGIGMGGMGLGAPSMGMPAAAVERKSSVTTILTVIVKVLTTSKDLALRGQMAESLKTLLELPMIEENPNVKNIVRSREDPTTERFLQYFYDSCIVTLYRPLMEVLEFKDVTDATVDLTRDQSSLLLYLCDNLCNFVVQHSHRSQFYVLSTNISRRVATLLKAREKHLRLAALRFFRMCLKMNNNFLVRHLIKNELFSPVLELASREARRDNLLNSACQEFFEHIRKENIWIVINHVMDKYEPRVRELCKFGSMAERFRGLVVRWEQNNEPPPKDDKTSALRRLGRPGTGVLTAAIMDAEHEEDYFNTSDDEEITTPSSPPVPTAGSSIGMKRKRSLRGAVSGLTNPRSRIPTVTGSTMPTPTPGIVLPSPYPMTKLVDYDDVEEDGGSPRDRTPPEDDGTKDAAAEKAVAGPSTGGGLVRTRSSSNLMANGNGRKVNGASSPPQKRRREDDDDDTLGLLAGAGGGAKGNKRANVASSTRSSSAQKSGSASEDEKPATTSPSVIPTLAPSSERTLRNAAGGVAKIKLSLGKAGFGIAAAPVPVPTSTKETEGADR